MKCGDIGLPYGLSSYETIYIANRLGIELKRGRNGTAFTPEELSMLLKEFERIKYLKDKGINVARNGTVISGDIETILSAPPPVTPIKRKSEVEELMNEKKVELTFDLATKPIKLKAKKVKKYKPKPKPEPEPVEVIPDEELEKILDHEEIANAKELKEKNVVEEEETEEDYDEDYEEDLDDDYDEDEDDYDEYDDEDEEEE